MCNRNCSLSIPRRVILTLLCCFEGRSRGINSQVIVHTSWAKACCTLVADGTATLREILYIIVPTTQVEIDLTCELLRPPPVLSSLFLPNVLSQANCQRLPKASMLSQSWAISASAASLSKCGLERQRPRSSTAFGGWRRRFRDRTRPKYGIASRRAV